MLKYPESPVAETHSVFRAETPTPVGLDTGSTNDPVEPITVVPVRTSNALADSCEPTSQAPLHDAAVTPHSLRGLLKYLRDKLLSWPRLSWYVGMILVEQSEAPTPLAGNAYVIPGELNTADISEPLDTIEPTIIDRSDHSDHQPRQDDPDDFEALIRPETGEKPGITGIFAEGFSSWDLTGIIGLDGPTVALYAAGYLARQAEVQALRSDKPIDLGFNEEEEQGFMDACRAAYVDLLAEWGNESQVDPPTFDELVRLRRSVALYNQVEQAAKEAYQQGCLYVELKSANVQHLSDLTAQGIRETKTYQEQMDHLARIEGDGVIDAVIESAKFELAQQHERQKYRIVVARHNAITTSIRTAAIMNDNQMRVLELDRRGLGDLQDMPRDRRWRLYGLRREFMDEVARRMYLDGQVGILQATREVYESMREAYGPGIEDARIPQLQTMYRRIYHSAHLPAA